MRTLYSRGVTRVELMALVLVIAVSLAIIVIAIQSARESGRRAQCQNNMRNIGLALVNFQTSKNHFPSAGTFYDDPAVHQGDPLKSTIYRAITNPGAHPGEADSWLHSWVIDTSPYYDVADFYNAWDKQRSYLSTVRSNTSFLRVTNSVMAAIPIGVLRCPDDFTALPDHGNLSYVVNGGFARWHAAPVGWAGSRIDGRATNGDVLQ
jgi:type II secretory pathway pseudopilin PulG